MSEAKIEIGSRWVRNTDGEVVEINVITGYPAMVRLAFVAVDAVFWLTARTLRRDYSPQQDQAEAELVREFIDPVAEQMMHNEAKAMEGMYYVPPVQSVQVDPWAGRIDLDFGAALQAMRAGKRVRRAAWGVERFDSETYLVIDREHKRFTLWHDDCRWDWESADEFYEDILAADWLVAEDASI